jgi:hypothetical protein
MPMKVVCSAPLTSRFFSVTDAPLASSCRLQGLFSTTPRARCTATPTGSLGMAGVIQTARIKPLKACSPFSRRNGTRAGSTTPVERDYRCAFQACSISLQGWGLIDSSTAHVISIPHFTFKGSLVHPRLRASNEHIPIMRVPRAGGRPGCPPHPSVAARCASTEDPQPPSPPLLPKYETRAGVVPAFLIMCVPRAKGSS